MPPLSNGTTSSPRGDGQRLAALARSAANLAARETLDAVLIALAEEIHQLGDVAGVQVVLAEGDHTLQLMGAAGFAADPEFFGTLAACRDRGADLATIRALRTGLQVVILNRKRDMLSSEAWAPMHPYLREVEWSDFVATPFDLQGTGTGVINCYMATNGLPDDEVKAFFRSMAALAALAIDHHQLIRRDREQARLDERARIARDLHDSVLQHLFAIGMQSKALERQAVELGRSGEAILAMAREFHETSVSARSELRSIIESARVTSLDESGIAAALERVVARWRNDRLRIDLTVDARAETLPPGLVEDLYFILTESIFNALRHANPTRIGVQVQVAEVVQCTVVDDGSGLTTGSTTEGFGFVSMRQRVERWGGQFHVTSTGTGTCVSVRFGPFVVSPRRRA